HTRKVSAELENWGNVPAERKTRPERGGDGSRHRELEFPAPGGLAGALANEGVWVPSFSCQRAAGSGSMHASPLPVCFPMPSNASPLQRKRPCYAAILHLYHLLTEQMVPIIAPIWRAIEAAGSGP